MKTKAPASNRAALALAGATCSAGPAAAQVAGATTTARLRRSLDLRLG